MRRADGAIAQKMVPLEGLELMSYLIVMLCFINS